jgi:hypothetical protein
MAGRGTGPDFVEALARGLDVLTAFGPAHRAMSLSEVAETTGLARPTARRLLLTLEELGYVRAGAAGYALTPMVLDLGMAYVGSLGLWDLAERHRPVRGTERREHVEAPGQGLDEVRSCSPSGHPALPRACRSSCACTTSQPTRRPVVHADGDQLRSVRLQRPRTRSSPPARFPSST